MKRADPDAAEHQLPLTADNLLLRGCSLRKTDWVVGVVVYTGIESRIMMNRTPSPRKVSSTAPCCKSGMRPTHQHRIPHCTSRHPPH